LTSEIQGLRGFELERVVDIDPKQQREDDIPVNEAVTVN
jgi:hypothetical protein